MKQIALVWVLLLAGCGGTAADYLQAAIDSTRASCTAMEWQIVAREGSTKEQDEAALAEIRDYCNRAYRALDELTKGQ